MSIDFKRVSISGDSVTTTVSVNISGQATNVSGNIVYLTSGQNTVQFSGQGVWVSGTVATSISGNAVNLSGQGVWVSGTIATSVSGNNVTISTSGQGVWVSGVVAVTTSGQGVWISGTHPVTTSISGNAVIFSGQGVWVSGTVITSISGNAVNLSGQGVWVSGTVATSVSGNAVIFSGQGVWVSGTIRAQISGDAVNLSGQGVWVSGTVAVTTSGQGVWISGTHPVTTSVSGNVVDMKSGQVFINAFDPSGAVWNNIWVDNSGQHRILVATSGQKITVSGDAVTTTISGNAVTTNVSGNTLYVVSGKSYLQAYDPSGTVWNDVWVNTSGGHKLQADVTVNATANISGQVVNIASIEGSGLHSISLDSKNHLMVYMSGQTVTTSISGNVVVASVTTNVSGNTVYVVSGKSYLQAFDPSGVVWNDVWVNNSGQHRLLVSFSGEGVWVSGSVSVSGNAVTTTVSGNVVIASFSGQGVWISGTVILNSGRTQIVGSVNANPVSVDVLTDNMVHSGNAFLTASALLGMRELSGLTRIRVTESGQSAPMSGIGYKLAVEFSGSIANARISGQAIRLTDGQGNQLINIFSAGGGLGSYQDGLTVVTISGSLTSTLPGSVTSVSGNVVDSKSGRSFNYVFDASGNIWNSMYTNVSGGHAIVTAHSQPASYFARATAVTIRSGMHTFVIMHQSGDPSIKIKSLEVFTSAEYTSATMSGINMVKFDVLRIKNTSGGGTSITPVVTDPLFSGIGVGSIVIQHSALSGCSVDVTMLTHVASNLPHPNATISGLAGTVFGTASGVANIGGLMAYQLLHAQQGTNVLNPVEIIDFADITLRSGWGISLRQSTDANYTAQISGQFDVTCMFTIE